MKSINENSSSSESQNQSSSDSNSNSNSMGGIVAGGSWVIDSMQAHTTDSKEIVKEVEKEVVILEGGGVGDEESDYVVDIYMQSDITEGEDSNVPKNPETGSHIPVVQVDGYAKMILFL